MPVCLFRRSCQIQTFECIDLTGLKSKISGLVHQAGSKKRAVFKIGIFSKSKGEITTNLPDQSIMSVWTPGGSDGCGKALELAENYITGTSKKALVIELPCSGIPRLAMHLDGLKKERSVENLILEYERTEKKDEIPLLNYLDNIKGLDNLYLLKSDPYSYPDTNVYLKLDNMNTLVDFPSWLAKRFCNDFGLIIFILQGQMWNPMTMISLKRSAYILLSYEMASEIGWIIRCYDRLKSCYKQKDNKFIVLAKDQDIKIFKEATDIYMVTNIESVLKRIGDLFANK